MDIKQLQYFVVSVDMGSFRAAAQMLITSQPNVSKVIKSLESELNTVLLERRHDGIAITLEGERIYKYAIDVLKNVKMITDYTAETTAKKFSIATVPCHNLADCVSGFSRDFPKNSQHLEYWQGSVEEVIRRVHRRYSELGFVYVSHRNKETLTGFAKSKSIEFTELTRSNLYLYVGKNSPYYHREYVEEKELENMKSIQHYDEDFPLRNHFGHLREDIAKNKNSIRTNSDSLVLQLLRNTDYVSMGSSFNKKNYEEYSIKSILIKSMGDSVSFGYVSRYHYGLSPLAREFITYLKAKIRD